MQHTNKVCVVPKIDSTEIYDIVESWVIGYNDTVTFDKQVHPQSIIHAAYFVSSRSYGTAPASMTNMKRYYGRMKNENTFLYWFMKKHGLTKADAIMSLATGKIANRK